MIKSVEQIKDDLTSNDMGVLKVCHEFIEARLESERARGEAAERRANIVLSAVGGASVFLVLIAINLFYTADRVNWFVAVIYTGSVLWVARSVWYSMKGLATQSRYRMRPESVLEWQEKSEIEFTKYIIAGKLWEYQQSVQPNTERLFYVQRGQRALVVFVVLAMFQGLAIMVSKYISVETDVCVLSVIGVLGAALWFCGDWLVENAGIWNHR